MLKMIAYPMVVLAALVIMGHTKSPSSKSSPDVENSIHGIVLSNIAVDKITASVKHIKADCYNSWQLRNAGLSEDAFNYAMKGFEYLKSANMIAKTSIISIVDFSKSSSQKRLFVIDINTGQILFNSLVAHGRNSGNEFATRFSNLPESHQSSLGFYITMGTYNGGNGYSLRLKGCEKGINDKAYERAIVIHGADYVSNKFISNRGEAGRSYGCPALPTELNKKIIDVIKDGSCLFLYHPTKKYCSSSKIINSQI
jgi:hypothetical protein